MKIQLTPSDLMAILKDHPETLVELREKAAQQVANAITAKEVDRLKERVGNEVSRAVRNSLQTTAYISKLSNEGQRLVTEAFSKMLAERDDASLRKKVNQMVTEAIDSSADVVVQRVVEKLDDRIEAGVRKALARVVAGDA